MKRGDVFFYQDELRDDFKKGSQNLERQKTVDLRPNEEYTYTHGRFWEFLSNLTFLALTPIAWGIAKILFGLRIKNRQVLKKLNGGVYIYSTHTHPFLDSVLPAIINWPNRRAYIVTGPAAVSGKLRFIVPFLGGIPLNNSAAGRKAFKEKISDCISRSSAVTILPEGHLWPYYSGVRCFSAASFVHPVQDNAPVIPAVLLYRSRRFRKNRPPHVTFILGDLISPQLWETTARPHQTLQEKVYRFMTATIEQEGSYSYVSYVKEEKGIA